MTFKPDTPIRWKPDYKPVAFPHTHGVVFTSAARVTFVTWNGTSRPVPVATVALEKA